MRSDRRDSLSVGKAALTLALDVALALVVIAVLAGLFLLAFLTLTLLVNGPVQPEPPPFWPPGNLV